jgi:hypothetical protein
MKSCKLLLLAIVPLATTLHAQIDARAVGAKDAYASPVLVVSPKSPARSAGDAASVEVKVKGTISAAGLLENPVFENASGKEKFVAAVKEVLHLWRFKPAVDLNSCRPVSNSGAVVVWFEDKNGKPSVSVAMPQTGGRSEAVRAGGEGSVVKVAHRPRADFPADARDIGADGAAEVLLKLDGRGDNVQQALLYATPHSMFGESALASARGVRIAAEGAKAQCVAVAYHFCIDQGVNFPNSACDARRLKNAL